MPSQTLPTISLNDKDSDQAFVASLHEYGFAALTDHPIDMTLVDRIYDTWRGFFNTDEKFHYPYRLDTQDGYFGLEEAESAKGSDLKDYKEYFHFYPWGQCPETLRQDLLDYYRQAETFAKQLLNFVDTFSPEKVSNQFFEPLSNMIHDSDSSLLRILHYPAISDDIQQPRASAHEDINLLTLLPASDGPGLEILDRTGQWLQIDDKPDQVIINTGDMLAEASGQYFPSTTHRVSVTAGSAGSASRMSLPLFLHPRADVRLSNRYLAGDYLNERLQELGVI